MVKGRSFAAIAAIVVLLLLLTAAVIFFAPAGVAVAQESGESGEPQGDAWYLILILALLVFGEIVGVIAIKRGDKKRAKDKEGKDDKGLAAAMFGGALPAWQIGVLIALEVVFVVLAVYIIYLLRRSPKAAVAADIACDESQEDAQAKEQATKERAYEEAPASIAAPEEVEESAKEREETLEENAKEPEETLEESEQAPEDIPEESEQAPEEIPEESGQAAPEEIPEESEPAPEETFEEPQESEDEKLLAAFKRAKGLKLSRSFTAKLILASFESKEYFAQLSNALLAHKKVKCRIGWNDAVFNRGRTKIAKMTLRGKTLWLFLPLEAEKQEEKYRCVDQSDKVKYQAVPCGMKIKSGRGVKRALELIQKVAEQNGLSPAPPARLFAAAEYPEDSVKNLIARDLIRVYPKQKKLPEELEELLQGESYTPSSFLSPFRTSRGRVEIEHGEENWKKTPAARERILQASASMGKVFNSRYKREK